MITTKDIQSLAKGGMELPSKRQSLTIGKSINEQLAAAKLLPRIKQLFGSILIEFTINIWGGDNGIGKSILIMALAECMARGKELFGMKNESEAIKVLLYDFELTDRALLKRYTDEQTGVTYQFSDNLLRYHLDTNTECESDNKYNDRIMESIREDVLDTEAKVIIIDNMTALVSQSNSDADVALPLMRNLKKLRDELQITIIILAHINKMPTGFSIEKNHISGSKRIQDLCDGMVGIARSQSDSELIYLKELKNRNEMECYNSDNVLVCRKVKNDSFLTFDFIEFDDERNHVGNKTEEEPSTTLYGQHIQYVLNLKSQGKTLEEIAEEVLGSKTKKGTISKWLNKAKQEGKVSNVSVFPTFPQNPTVETLEPQTSMFPTSFQA